MRQAWEGYLLCYELDSLSHLLINLHNQSSISGNGQQGVTNKFKMFRYTILYLDGKSLPALQKGLKSTHEIHDINMSLTCKFASKGQHIGDRYYTALRNKRARLLCNDNWT